MINFIKDLLDKHAERPEIPSLSRKWANVESANTYLTRADTLGAQDHTSPAPMITHKDRYKKMAETDLIRVSEIPAKKIQDLHKQAQGIQVALTAEKNSDQKPRSAQLIRMGFLPDMIAALKTTTAAYRTDPVVATERKAATLEIKFAGANADTLFAAIEEKFAELLAARRQQDTPAETTAEALATINALSYLSLVQLEGQKAAKETLAEQRMGAQNFGRH